MKLICTFISDNFSILKNYWTMESQKGCGSAFYGTEKVRDFGRGGLVIILDWETKKIIAKRKILAPRNLCILNNKLYLPKGNQEVLILSSDLKKRFSKFYNPHFNSLHWISKNSNGFLFASSGIDLVLQTDFKGKTLWEWWAIDHGFNIDPRGRTRELDKSKNYRSIKFGTLKQTTHLNSVLEMGKTKYFKDTIYCSFFHQGQIIAIDKKTGNYKVVMKNLKHPHALRKIKNRIMFCDTEHNRVIFTDNDFIKFKYYDIPHANWIQDSSILTNGNIIVADSNNNRLVEFSLSNKKIVDEFSFSKEWKIFSCEEIVC